MILQQALHVVGVVGNDQGVVFGKRRDQPVVRDHRLDHADQRGGVDVLELDHPRDVLVAMRSAGMLRSGKRRVERTLRAGTILITGPACTVVKPLTWSTDWKIE